MEGNDYDQNTVKISSRIKKNIFLKAVRLCLDSQGTQTCTDSQDMHLFTVKTQLDGD